MPVHVLAIGGIFSSWRAGGVGRPAGGPAPAATSTRSDPTASARTAVRTSATTTFRTVALGLRGGAPASVGGLLLPNQRAAVSPVERTAAEAGPEQLRELPVDSPRGGGRLDGSAVRGAPEPLAMIPIASSGVLQDEDAVDDRRLCMDEAAIRLVDQRPIRSRRCGQRLSIG